MGLVAEKLSIGRPLDNYRRQLDIYQTSTTGRRIIRLRTSRGCLIDIRFAATLPIYRSSSIDVYLLSGAPIIFFS